MNRLLRSVWSGKERGCDVSDVLSDLGAQPILMDIGSAGESPADWKPFASASIIVGFEPDERNPDTTFGQDFAQAIMLNKVVVADDEADEAEFVLTEYPSCSSLLEPDLKSLREFVFRDYFKPRAREKVAATSLNRIFAEHDLPGVHWLKVDAQGLDLQILKSIAPDHLNQLLVADIEPGLVDAYLGEDLFPECFDWFKAEGFWLADLFCQSYAKMRPETLSELQGQGRNREQVLARLQKSPTAAEARFIRSVGWMEQHASDKSLWIMAFTFGLGTGYLGYAFDLISAYREKFGGDAQVTSMTSAANKELDRLLQ